MAASKEILEQVLSLSADEKAELVDQLIVSIDNPNKEMDQLWAMEAESRLDAYEKGNLKTVSLEEVLEKYK